MFYPGFKEAALYLLTRGKLGNINNHNDLYRFLQFLFSEYEKISTDYNNTFNWLQYNIDISSNPTLVPDSLLKEFLISPIKPTENFIKIYMDMCNSDSSQIHTEESAISKSNFRIGKHFPI